MAFRAPERGSNLPAGCKHLPAWFERVRARPAAQATNGN
jgi:glutathione S-transferase